MVFYFDVFFPLLHFHFDVFFNNLAPDDVLIILHMAYDNLGSLWILYLFEIWAMITWAAMIC